MPLHGRGAKLLAPRNATVLFSSSSLDHLPRRFYPDTAQSAQSHISSMSKWLRPLFEGLKATARPRFINAGHAEKSPSQFQYDSFRGVGYGHEV